MDTETVSVCDVCSALAEPMRAGDECPNCTSGVFDLDPDAPHFSELILMDGRKCLRHPDGRLYNRSTGELVAESREARQKRHQQRLGAGRKYVFDESRRIRAAGTFWI